MASTTGGSLMSTGALLTEAGTHPADSEA